MVGSATLPFFIFSGSMKYMVLLDGKKLAEKIIDESKRQIASIKKTLRLAVVVVGKDAATEKFIGQKKRVAEKIGVEVRIYPFEETTSTNELRVRLAEIVHEEKNTGVIIQLPLPEHINTQYILNAVTPEKDVDVLSARALGNFFVGKAAVFPPVVGAVQALCEEYKIEYQKKFVVIVGSGKLVGKPVAVWLMNEGATVAVLNEYTADIGEFTQRADIIISGAGQPKLIAGDIIKEGAVVIDAGTSESEGKVIGDVDFDSVVTKAGYLTPVPGGIGPLTVATLFKNLIILAKGGKKHESN